MHRDVKWKALRLSRRETLKGLGVLALGANALGVAACSSDETSGAPMTGAQAGTGPAPGGAPAAGTTPSAAGTSATTGTAGVTAGSKAAGSGGAGSPAAVSGGAGASAAGSSPAAGAPAAGSGGVAGMPSMAGAPAAGGGAAGASGAATDIGALQCIVTPAMTDGPFFVDNQMERSNLIMGETSEAVTKAVPLKLVIGVFKVDGMTCTPLSGVHVDIWHADALGIYSSVTPGAVQSVDTRNQKFLRGWQTSDASGIVTFDTAYPGWYMSRTIHIHFKLRMLGSGVAREFTSQMFFDEKVNAVVLAKPPYSTHSGRSVLNDGDHIYNGTATNNQKPPAGATPPGKNIMPVMVEMGTGYVGTLKIGVKMA